MQKNTSRSDPTFCRTSDVLHTINHLSSSPRRQHSGDLSRQNTSCRPSWLQSISRAAQPGRQASSASSSTSSSESTVSALSRTRGRGVVSKTVPSCSSGTYTEEFFASRLLPHVTPTPPPAQWPSGKVSALRLVVCKFDSCPVIQNSVKIEPSYSLLGSHCRWEAHEP